MIFLGGRSVARLPNLTLQCSGNLRRGLSSYVERVPTLHDVFKSQHHGKTAMTEPSIFRKSAIHRAYAQKAVSRPKAHTGRTTTTARKAPTTSKTKAAKPAPKKTTPKAVPKAKPRIKAKTKAKPRIKAKPKPAKTKRAKAKPKPKAKKSKKVLTEAQKSALTIKQLKATALKLPHQPSSTRWGVYIAEKARVEGSTAKLNFGEFSKEASADYKALTPEKLEHYNHLANQSKVANANSYRQWIESHTPATIHNANRARRHLARLGVKAFQLHDHRQVKGPRNSYNFYYMERIRTGDYRGLSIPESAKLVGTEWKALPAGQKKPFEDLAAQDMARYTQERKTVLNMDVHTK